MALNPQFEEPEPMNLTPMMDMVFNILIFFMLGSTIASEERELELQLPRVSAAAPLTEAPDEITVNVLADGRVVIGQEEYSSAALQTFLTTARQNYPEQAVAVRGHATVPYEKVAAVLSVARQVGISNVDVLVLEGE